MSAAEDKRGFKRICTSCSARFYDMNKRPIICPSCGAEFTGEVKIRTRRAKSAIVKDDAMAAVKAKAMEEDVVEDIEEEESEEAQIVSLDDDQIEASSEDDDEDVAAPDLDLDPGIDDFDDMAVDADEDDTDLEDEAVEGDEEPKE